MSNAPTTAINREHWLTLFAEAVTPLIEKRAGIKVPLSKTRLACSFPKGRATPNRKTGKFTSGQCFHADSFKSGLHEILINPIRDDRYEIAETVIHELIHASLVKGTGHKAPFARAAKAVGLEGKPTETVLSTELRETLGPILDSIGPYPHKKIDGEWGRKQTTRLLKVQCVDCGYVNEQGNGYTARITLTWIENAGLPTCPCGATMSLIEKGEEADIVALKPVESAATYSIPGVMIPGTNRTDEGRFQIRRTSTEWSGDSWTVIDYGDRMLEDSAPRIVSAEGKTHALDMIDAIREGLFTWDSLEDEQHGWDEGEDDGANPLADEDPDLDKLLYIEDDEDEVPEHPEDQEPESVIERKRFQGQWVEREVAFDYDAVAKSRER
jgi:hypothetical protein